MAQITKIDGGLSVRTEVIAPAIADIAGSLSVRTDAGNVGLFIATDSVGTWAQFLTTAGGSTITGNMTVQGRITTTDGVTSGTARIVGGQAKEAPAASTAVANVLTVFSTGSYSMVANTFKVSTVCQFEALIGITAVSGGGATVQVEVFLNGVAGTLVFDTTALNVAAGVAVNSYLTLTGRLACRATGAGTLVGVLQYQLGAINASPGTNSSDVAGSVAGTYTCAITTTNVNTLDIAAVTDAAGTTVVLQDYHVYMEG